MIPSFRLKLPIPHPCLSVRSTSFPGNNASKPSLFPHAHFLVHQLCKCDLRIDGFVDWRLVFLRLGKACHKPGSNLASLHFPLVICTCWSFQILPGYCNQPNADCDIVGDEESVQYYINHYHFPSLISATATAWCVLTTSRWITETDKSSTGYIESPRNVFYRMHGSSMPIVMFIIAIRLHCFLACTTCYVEPLPTSRLIGMKISTPRLYYCTAIGAFPFVFVSFHSFPFN